MMTSPTKRNNLLIQCDFDGTITESDVSFVLLDTFAGKEWRRLLEDYKERRISVGHLNREAFSMVKADKQNLVEAMNGQYKVRAGFHELVSYCRREDIRFVIVSNGLDFYIDTILKGLGLQDIEVFAAQTRFSPEGLQVQYIGPEGNVLDEGFKEAHVDSFLKSGYQVVYAGNGTSDFPPAKKCQHIFATGDLVSVCKRENAVYTAFEDMNEIIKGLELL